MMKSIILKLIQISVIILIVILFLFILVDCKMESEKFRLQAALLLDENEKLRIETEELQKHYALTILRLIEEKKIHFEDLTSLLPEKEIQRIKSFPSLPR